jgi:hypothetical protein
MVFRDIFRIYCENHMDHTHTHTHTHTHIHTHTHTKQRKTLNGKAEISLILQQQVKTVTARH